MRWPCRQPADFGFEHLSELPAVGALFGSGRFFGGVQHFLFRLFAERRGAGRRVATAVVDAGVHDDPVHPRGQLRVLPEPVERPVDLDEHLLRDVLGVVMVAGELVRHAVHHRSMPLDERLEGGSSRPPAAREIRSESADITLDSLARTRGSSPCHAYDAAAGRKVDRTRAVISPWLTSKALTPQRLCRIRHPIRMSRVLSSEAGMRSLFVSSSVFPDVCSRSRLHVSPRYPRRNRVAEPKTMDA